MAMLIEKHDVVVNLNQSDTTACQRNSPGLDMERIPHGGVTWIPGQGFLSLGIPHSFTRWSLLAPLRTVFLVFFLTGHGFTSDSHFNIGLDLREAPDLIKQNRPYAS